MPTYFFVKPRSKRSWSRADHSPEFAKFFRVITIVFLLGLVSTSSWASPVTYHLQGINFPESIRAVAVLDYQPSSGTITVSLANTSTVVSSITAFAFNLPPEVIGVESFSVDLSSNWDYLFDRDAITTPNQLGNFDLAGLTKKDFNGGKVQYGIFPGQTFQFTFTLSGSGLEAMNTADFSLLSADPGLGQPLLQPMAVRFQGIMPDDESDVGVSDDAVPHDDDFPSVPLPGAVWLFGSGLLSLFIWRKKHSS